MNNLRLITLSKALPGVLYCILIAFISFISWNIFKPISPTMWAFIYSIIIVNIRGLPSYLNQGLNFSSSQLLRFIVALLGLVTSALIWTRVGSGVIVAFIVISSSLALSFLLCWRLGLNFRLASLIGAGTAICGASAIAALTPAIGAKEEESGLALSVITLFGLVSMFLYPLLYLSTPINGMLGGNLDAYAIWVGAGVHETAQVIGAASAVSVDAVAPAMLIKSVRIFMIGPITFLLSWICCKFEPIDGKRRFVIPFFAVAFLINSLICAVLDLNYISLLSLGFDWQSIKLLLSGTIFPFLLATAFAGVGSRVRFKSLSGLGAKPLFVAAGVAVTGGTLALLSAILIASSFHA